VQLFVIFIKLYVARINIEAYKHRGIIENVATIYLYFND